MNYNQILVGADGNVLYLGRNPIMVLGLRLMGRKLSELGNSAHEYQLNPKCTSLLNTNAFNKAMAKLGVRIVDWDAERMA